jgi:hypothetical protein
MAQKNARLMIKYNQKKSEQQVKASNDNGENNMSNKAIFIL